MKYSLRSLMRFSIRDLFLITVIAATLAAWLADHRLQRGMREEAEKARDQAEKNLRLADDRFIQAKSYLQSKGHIVAEHGEGRVAFGDPSDWENKLPTSQAPDTIPPKP
jgi:hypothetical protein